MMGAPQQDDRIWADLIGSTYTARQVADMLGLTEDQVRGHPGLLALKQRNGKIVYPSLQFAGQTPIVGVDHVIVILRPVVATSWTIASWLATPCADLAGDRPIDRLAAGDISTTLTAAHRAAHSLR